MIKRTALVLVALHLSIGLAWAEMASVSAGLPVASAGERTEAEKEEIAKLLAIAKQTKSASRKYSAELDISNHPYIGSDAAPMALIEFGSYQCGYCRKHFANTFPTLKSDYVDTGKLRYVFFDLALDKRHQHAAKAAEAAHCANEQDKFLPYRSALFTSKKVASEFLYEHAESLGLDSEEFALCLQSERHLDRPEADRLLSRKLRVRGTPSFFLGRPNADGSAVTIVRRIGGARPYGFFSQHLDTLYASVTSEDSAEIAATAPEVRGQ